LPRLSADRSETDAQLLGAGDVARDQLQRENSWIRDFDPSAARFLKVKRSR
jgi:hypothetical protein